MAIPLIHKLFVMDAQFLDGAAELSMPAIQIRPTI